MKMFFEGKIPASFRDPDGFLFMRNGVLYRQVNLACKDDYDSLMGSGLYKALIDRGLLITHEETGLEYAMTDQACKIIKPCPIPFISYPYEWCFSQLKDAALVTLQIQKIALKSAMTLKDASIYNIQLLKCRPIFVDTLSFQKYKEGEPWVAYRQFCQHFLIPLALMSHTDIRLSQLLRVFIDGIPLDLASRLLPFNSRLNLALLLHIHLHAKSQRHFAASRIKKEELKQRLSRHSLLGLIDSLEAAVAGLKWKPSGTEWADYYKDTNYSDQALQQKKELVSNYLGRAGAKNVWDLGANTGLYSRIAASAGAQVVSFDIDPAACEINYLACKKDGQANILPILLDLANPSPGIGWQNQERLPLIERANADTVLALALIHHLAISNNLPFDKIAEFFSSICSWLIIEFIPKTDSQVERLLSMREDIFPDYTKGAFEVEFAKFFSIEPHAFIGDSNRVLYLMRKK